MEALLALFVELGRIIVDFLANVFHAGIVEPLTTNSDFRSGFIRGFIVAGLIGFVARHLTKRYEQLSGFFKATKDPATKEGPSQAAKAISTSTDFVSTCGCLVFVVLLVGALLFVVLLAAFR